MSPEFSANLSNFLLEKLSLLEIGIFRTILPTWVQYYGIKRFINKTMNLLSRLYSTIIYISWNNNSPMCTNITSLFIVNWWVKISIQYKQITTALWSASLGQSACLLVCWLNLCCTDVDIRRLQQTAHHKVHNTEVISRLTHSDSCFTKWHFDVLAASRPLSVVWHLFELLCTKIKLGRS